jgi:ABC-type dipeptide/oligopeptide/nickel transport system permease component
MPEHHLLRILLSAAGRFIVLLLLVGLATTCLVRLGPGFGTDERELDPRLSNASIEAIRTSSDKENVIRSYYFFLQRAVRGDLGTSQSLNRSVSELIHQRYGTTLRILTLGLFVGWLVAFVVATIAAILPARAVSLWGTVGGTAILCVPSALLAYVCYLAHAPASFIVGLIVFARVFRVLDDLFRSARHKLHILAARAHGISRTRIFWRHILADTRGELIALGGASVSIAVSGAIVAEALCDEAGLGQMAWKAALARDFPLLVSLTFLITATTLLFNRLADTLVRILERRA